MKKISLYVMTLLFSATLIAGQSYAQESTTPKSKPASQEQLDEQELEEVYGVNVERDVVGENSTAVTTRDRLGDGRVSLFQDSTKSKQNLETNDTIGVEVKLFEFK